MDTKGRAGDSRAKVMSIHTPGKNPSDLKLRFVFKPKKLLGKSKLIFVSAVLVQLVTFLCEVCMLSWCRRGFPPPAPFSLHSIKAHTRLTGDSTLQWRVVRLVPGHQCRFNNLIHLLLPPLSYRNYRNHQHYTKTQYNTAWQYSERH